MSAIMAGKLGGRSPFFMKKFLILILLLIPDAIIKAQNPIADANDQIQFDQTAPSLQDVQNFGYRYYLDNDLIGVDTVVTCSGAGPIFSCEMNIPILQPGTHTIQITASNGAGESPKSSPFRFRFCDNSSSTCLDADSATIDEELFPNGRFRIK